jgi:hypothetical protein
METESSTVICLRFLKNLMDLVAVGNGAGLVMMRHRFVRMKPLGACSHKNHPTSLDYFVLASTLVVFLSMTEVIYTAYLSTNDQLEKARKIDRRARWVAPLIYSVMAAETLYFRIWV